MDMITETYKLILDNFYDGIYLTDRDRKILYWNKAAERITGYPADQVLLSSCMDNILMHVDDEGTLLCKNLCPLAKTIEDGNLRNAIVYLHHADGHRVPVSVHISPLINETGEIIGAVESFRDQTSQLAAFASMAELQAAALIDPLTEVGNRRFTEATLQKMLARKRDEAVPFGVIFSDLDEFKIVNDTYGHLVGDRVLKMVAKTLVNNLKSQDFVGRWGGDEMIMILDNISSDRLAHIANKLRALVASAYLVIDNQRLQITVSMGASSAVNNDNIQSLIERVDRALYCSKTNGRNRVHIFPADKGL